MEEKVMVKISEKEREMKATLGAALCVIVFLAIMGVVLLTETIVAETGLEDLSLKVSLLLQFGALMGVFAGCLVIGFFLYILFYMLMEWKDKPKKEKK